MENLNNRSNEEYSRQLDFVMQLISDAAGIVMLRVSAGICLSSVGNLEKLRLSEAEESIDSYIERIGSCIPLEAQRSAFTRLFSRQGLLDAFAKKQKTVSLECTMNCSPCFRYNMYRVTANLVKNSVTGALEAILCFSDITGSYLANIIPQMLYRKKYELTAIIDLHQKTICPGPSDDAEFSEAWSEVIDYDTFVRKRRELRIYPKEDWDMLHRKTSLPHLQNMLKNSGLYTLTVHQYDHSGEKRLKRYTYMYLQQELGMILVVIEDITDIYWRDVLTGGYNRQGFIRQTEQILDSAADRTAYAVLFFNIRNFRAFNELFGTSSGDQLLRQAYETISSSDLHPLVTARLDSDHFACLTERRHLHPATLAALCAYSFSRNGKNFRLFGRCGIYCVEQEPLRVASMIDRARLAKRCITDEYVQPFLYYNSSMLNGYIDRAELMGELSEAIRNDQFQVYYQPVVDPKTGHIASAEALVRWNHPTKGLLSPAVFIPAMEESGHISRLDLHIIKKVRAFSLARFHAGKAIVPISVNLSWMDLYDERLMRWVIGHLENNADTRHIARFEITETSYAALNSEHTETLEQLRRSGAAILLDDFGSGYSSFGMLQDHNFDLLKIDMSFVRSICTNPKTRIILTSIIDMAHRLGLKLVAEGAETAAQADFLREQGCDYIQGYYYFKPLPEDAFVRALEEQALGR